MSTSASSSKETYVDVLVVGAGPAGLMCANALAKAGVNFRIIDKRPIGVPAGQADGIQPRTIEVLQSYGLAERLMKEGAQMHMAAFYNPSPNGGIERTGRAADVTAPTARYPFKITLHQGAIENIFLDSLKSMDVIIERPKIPISIQLSENAEELSDPRRYPVKTIIRHLDPQEGEEETEILNAKFIVGADGAHSWIRKSFGITMDGEQTNYIWGVIDIIPDTDFPDIRNRTAIHSNNGSIMIIPREGDTVRLYIQLDDKDVINPETGRVDNSKMGPEKLLRAAQRSMHPFYIKANEYKWWAIYIIGQRVASKFSVHERVFIAGDACHTHSPKAGQGMNASMNDTHNLAWKLAHVLCGWADLSLMKTYELERRKYAQDLIDFDRKFAALFSGKPRTEENQDGVTHAEFLEAFQAFGGFTSGIGIHYPPSAITNAAHQVYASNLIIGQRMLPHVFVRAADGQPYEIQDLLPADTRFKVLVFAGDITESRQMQRVKLFASYLEESYSFYRQYGAGSPEIVFDVLTMCSTGKDQVNYTDVPANLRPHWSKVLLDDTDMYGRVGGGGYEAFGINPNTGAVVIVRPDGYVGFVAPFEDMDSVAKYFASFTRIAPSPRQRL